MSVSRPVLLSLLLASLLSVGCNTGSRDGASGSAAAGSTASVGTATTAPPSTAPATPGTTTPPPSGGTTPPGPGSNVGSRFWYEGDDFANPLETHSATEAGFAQQVLNLTNQERTSRGLNPLQYDAEAERAAKAHCEDMQGRSFFDHFTVEGWDQHDRLLMLGANPSALLASGENIAVGQPTPADVVQAWMNSPGHRANILYPTFTHLGIGVSEDSLHWAQVFTTR